MVTDISSCIDSQKVEKGRGGVAVFERHCSAVGCIACRRRRRVLKPNIRRDLYLDFTKSSRLVEHISYYRIMCVLLCSQQEWQEQ